MFYFDPLYLVIMAVTLVISLAATGMVKAAFAKYSHVRATNGKTGAKVAEDILRMNGITNVSVEPVGRRFMPFGGDGILSDHYDPKARAVRLSPQVYGSSSVAAQAIAAHECGHAIQHARLYAPLKLRNAIVPVAGFGSHFSYVLIILGIIMNAMLWVKLGIALFAIVVAFQFLTIPVEVNASSRAKEILKNMGGISPEQTGGVSAVLNAAALTYVAAAAAALLNLLYLLLRSGIIGGRRD